MSNPPPLYSLGVLIVFILFFALLGTMLTLSMNDYFSIDGMLALSQLEGAENEFNRNYTRLTLFISHLFTFILPSLLFAQLFYKKTWRQYLKLDSISTLNNIMLAIMLIFVAFPLAQYLFWLNKQIPLPEWMITQEDTTNKILAGLTASTKTSELLLNIFVIALVPAMGEELVFRGILQDKMMQLAKNQMVGIWLTAFIFSAIHFQFQGFLARFLLGALLGYLVYWTGSLWTAIFAHFANNGVQVFAQYLYQKKMHNVDLEAVERVPWWSVVVSLVLVLAIANYFHQKKQSVDSNVQT